MMATESKERSDRPDAGTGGLGVDARWRVLLRRLTRSRFAVLGLGIVALLFLVAALAPYIAPYEPSAQNYDALMQSPSLNHLFGTDTYGRDVFSRVVYGARYTVFLGVVIVGIQMIIGVTLGLVAGYYG